MSDDSIYLNLSDEVDISISTFIRDATNTKNLNELCDLDGEVPDPFEVLLRQLEYIESKIVPEAIDRVRFLQSHKHEYDEDDFCIHCGQDGRA